MEKIAQFLKQFFKDEEGVTAIEYGLIAALVALVIITALTLAGSSLNVLWLRISSVLASAAAG